MSVCKARKPPAVVVTAAVVPAVAVVVVLVFVVAVFGKNGRQGRVRAYCGLAMILTLDPKTCTHTRRQWMQYLVPEYTYLGVA